MRRNRPSRLQRSSIFVGCEGESERGYIAFLAGLAEQAALPVHLDSIVLQPGGGDPLDIVKLAVKQLAKQRNKRRIPYQAKFVMLDRDKLGQAPARDAQIDAIATHEELLLVWQAPCHEGMLLRHLEHCATLRPPSTPIANAQIAQRWPEYEKPMSRADLAVRLDRTSVMRAMSVEPDLERLIDAIGLFDSNA